MMFICLKHFAKLAKTRTIAFYIVLWALCFLQIVLFVRHERINWLSSFRASHKVRTNQAKRGSMEVNTVGRPTKPLSHLQVSTKAAIVQKTASNVDLQQVLVVHPNSDSRMEPNKLSKDVLVIPNQLSIKEEVQLRELGLSFLDKRDQDSVMHLIQFLDKTPDVHGATCLQMSLRRHVLKKRSGLHLKRSLGRLFGRSWCHYSRRDWSIQIRNTGNIESVTLSVPGNSNGSVKNTTYIYQICNIVSSAFLIRKESFFFTKKWRPQFGQLGILDFFIQSNGQFKIAKMGSCFISDSRHKVDRGKLEGTKDFPDYGTFGQQHGILRIIQEDRIEWTHCVARGMLCKEEPYVPPKTLPGIGLPICCSVVLGHMLKDLVQVLIKLGIRHRIIYGTLLGGIRNKAIIPWTHDIDISLHKEDYGNETFFQELGKQFFGRYFVGTSFMGVPRMIPLFPPHMMVNTASFYSGQYDIQGDKFFTREINNSVIGLLPFNNGWRERGYLDFYQAPDIWWNGSAMVTINGEQYITLREFDFELKNWYGKDYMKPVRWGMSWNGLSDEVS